MLANENLWTSNDCIKEIRKRKELERESSSAKKMVEDWKWNAGMEVLLSIFWVIYFRSLEETCINLPWASILQDTRLLKSSLEFGGDASPSHLL